MGMNISRKKLMGKNLRQIVNKIRAADSDNLSHFRLQGRRQEESIPQNLTFRPKKPSSIEPLDS